MKEINNLEALEILQKDYSHLFGKWVECGCKLYKIENNFGSSGSGINIEPSNVYRIFNTLLINLNIDKKITSQSFEVSINAKHCLKLMKNHKRIWDELDLKSKYFC